MKKSKIWVEVVANDIHIPKHNSKSVNCLFEALKIIKPDGITLNGDIGDWSTFSRHDRFSPPKCHWTDSQFLDASEREYFHLNIFLDKLQYLAPQAKKRYNFGNHEQWVVDFINESPRARKAQFSIEERLSLEGRKYEVNPYTTLKGQRHFTQLGKLFITHGLYTGQHHAKKHVDMMGQSVLYGHLHDIQVYSKITPQDVSHMAWCNGCLCDMGPNYLKGNPTNWNHGFAIVYKWPNGEFQVDIIRIQDGKCVVNGQEIVG